MAETTSEATPRTPAKKTAKKAAAKKAAAKKSTSSRTGAKKAPTSKAANREVAEEQAPARKAPARRATPKDAAEKPSSTPPRSHEEEGSNSENGHGATAGGSSEGRPKASNGGRAALLAAQQLVELTGKEFEGIVGISRTDDGWTAQVEILEMRRIPDTTDVLAVYEVVVDEDGDLVEYRRTDRYTRGSAGEDRR